MTTFTDAESRPQDLTIIRGIPAAINAPRLAEVLSQIQAEAKLRNQRLERIEFRKKGDPESDARVFWVVADFPEELGFESVHEAQETIEDEIHVRSVGEHEVGDNPGRRLGALHHLLSLAKEANERDAFNAFDACVSGFRMPSTPLPCRMSIMAPFYGRKSLDRKVAEVGALAVRLGAELLLVWVQPEGASNVDEHGLYWTLVPKGDRCSARDTDEAFRWLSGKVRARTSVLPTDAMTLGALEAVRERAERRLAEIGG